MSLKEIIRETIELTGIMLNTPQIIMLVCLSAVIIFLSYTLRFIRLTSHFYDHHPETYQQISDEEPPYSPIEVVNLGHRRDPDHPRYD